MSLSTRRHTRVHFEDVSGVEEGLQQDTKKMTGSRLGRGRGGRMAVYLGCGVVIVLLVLLYRAATTEMARLRELHVQCAHQQEALAAQLQVIFEYKVRLENSLADEKNSNAAVKEELQKRASREKSLRDKDSIEATQRFNSLQQNYKILQTEHKDLQGECDKRQKQALEESNRLETTLRDLRSQLKQAREDKEKSMEHLKSKHMELETEKADIEKKYDQLKETVGTAESRRLHLEKEVIQLKRELEEARKSYSGSPSPGAVTSSRSAQQQQQKQQVDQPQLEQSGRPSSKRQSAQPSVRQQSARTTAAKLVTPQRLESSTKSSVVVATVSQDVPRAIAGQKINKLPLGVPPIPRLIEPEEKRADADEKRDETAQHSHAKNQAPLREADDKEKSHVAEVANLEAPLAAVGRRVGEEIFDRQGDWNYPGVVPGVQEIGDEPNHVEKMAGFEDGGARQGDDAAEYQYDGADYERDAAQKNNDIRLEEGGDEMEDEDDRMEYDNNLKQKPE